MFSEEAIHRFLSKIEISPSGCWIWVGTNSKSGYGMFKEDGKYYRAHRYSYEFFIGQIPDGLLIRHKECNNPLCVNPEHLLLGSHQDNMNDMTSSGRQAYGEANGRAKLTAGDVEVIRHLYSTKSMKQAELASVFGVHRTQISHIVRGTQWS
jgi:predicted XRE-type DNA-binding protein